MARKTSGKSAKAAPARSRATGPRRGGGDEGGRDEGGKKPQGFTDAEKSAMKERARELKAEARAGKSKAEGERAVLAKIAQMPEPDRTLGQRLHTIVAANAPALWPKLWYGMPAYANPPTAPTPPTAPNAGKVVCFFQAATKFKTRYASFAFTDAAKLDEGVAEGLWATGFGLKAGGLTAAEEAKIAALVKKAVS